MQSNKTIIEFKNIVKTYGVGDAQTYALNGVDLSIKEGEFVAIMGASGSGKSTAMNMIGCLDKPTSGEYLFNGINVENLNRNQMALLRRNFLGFVFQSFNLLGRTSALENVELPLVYRKIPANKRKEMALEALTKVGLQSVVKNTPAQHSGGQQQRVAIARAIVSHPLVLLADEPNIREVIAFAKNGEGKDLMIQAPGPVSSEQLRDLKIEIKKAADERNSLQSKVNSLKGINERLELAKQGLAPFQQEADKNVLEAKRIKSYTANTWERILGYVREGALKPNEVEKVAEKYKDFTADDLDDLSNDILELTKGKNRDKGLSL